MMDAGNIVFNGYVLWQWSYNKTKQMEKEWEENIQKLFNVLNHFGDHGQYCYSENVLCVIWEKVTDILVISGVLENNILGVGKK